MKKAKKLTQPIRPSQPYEIEKPSKDTLEDVFLTEDIGVYDYTGDFFKIPKEFFGKLDDLKVRLNFINSTMANITLILKVKSHSTDEEFAQANKQYDEAMVQFNIDNEKYQKELVEYKKAMSAFKKQNKKFESEQRKKNLAKELEKIKSRQEQIEKELQNGG